MTQTERKGVGESISQQCRGEGTGEDPALEKEVNFLTLTPLFITSLSFLLFVLLWYLLLCPPFAKVWVHSVPWSQHSSFIYGFLTM